MMIAIKHRNNFLLLFFAFFELLFCYFFRVKTEDYWDEYRSSNCQENDSTDNGAI